MSIRPEALLDLAPGDRVALLLPSGHPVTRGALAAAQRVGATVVTPDPSLTVRDGVSWVDTAGITVLHLLPSVALAWAAHARTRRLPMLRRLVLAGEPIVDAVVTRWRALAPSASFVSVFDAGEQILAAGPLGRPARSGVHPLGAPLAGFALRVELADGTEAQVGVIGALMGERASLGPVPGGTRARRLADGRIEPIVTDGDDALDGREVAEIEAALSDVEGMEGVAVVRPSGEREGAASLSAFVVGGAAPGKVREALGELLRDDLDQMPIIAIAELPRRGDGHVDRARLQQAAALSRRSRSDLAASSPQASGPRTETEAAVADLWQKLLGARVGVEEDFFLAGGQSLLAAQLAARLSALLGVDMPLAVFFQQTTVAGQAAWIDRARSGAPAPIETSEPPRGAPLTHAQEQMVLFEQLSPGTTVHQLHWLFRIEGALDPALLLGAIRAITERQPALRTVVRLGGEGPTQEVLDSAPVAHESHDLTPLGEGAERAAIAHAEAAFHAPFVLTRGPLARTLLFRTGPSSHLLSLQVHHLILDHVSLNLWITELGELYAAAITNRSPSLPALLAVPADLARAEREALRSGALADEIAFWRGALADLPTGVDLPADRPRPRQPSHRGLFIPFTVPAAVASALREHARSRGATSFMAFLAATALLLTRLAGQTDLVIGAPVGGRDRPETRDLLGLFLNNVAIRVDAAGDPTFTALLDRARDAARAALANPTVPFERVVAEVSSARNAERHPLFDVMLNLVPEVTVLSLPGITITPEPGHNSASPLDLLISLRELGDGALAGDLRCAADLFDASTAERMTRMLVRVITHVAAAPETPITRVPLLDAEERAQVITRWNQTATAIGPDLVPAQIAATCDARPEAIAVIAPDGQLTFRALDRLANRIAHTLIARGLPREAPIAILAHRSLTLPAAVLAVLAAGGAFVLLDPDQPVARTRAMLVAAAPFAVLTQRSLLAHLPPDLLDRALFLDDPATFSDAPDHRLALSLAPEDLAYLMFTSGSTGIPKGVLVSHGALANRLAWVRELFPFRADEVVCQKTPLGFIDAIWELLAPLREGVTCLLPSDDEAHDPALLAEALERGGVTRIMLVPSLLRALLQHFAGRGGWLPRLTLWMIGGEELRPDLARDLWIEQPDAVIVNLYGCSEVAGESTYHLLEKGAHGRVPIGRSGPNSRAYVLDPHGEPSPLGVFGELCLGGAGVARGYLDDPTQTARRFVPDPFHPGGRMFKTGDRARRLEGGALDFAGRLDHELKIHGVRIDPAEIEEALRAHPAIVDAAVVPHDEGGTRSLVAYVVPREPAPRPRELRMHLRQRLPEPMVPARFVSLSALPLSPHGKLDRDALPAPIEAGVEETRPTTTTEAALAAIWEALLGTGPYGPDDDFFARGGYSLLLGQLALRIREALEVTVALAALFQDPTLAGQAQQIDDARRLAGDRPGIERVPRTARLPLSFAQERLWLGEALKFDALRHVVAVALRLRGALDPDRLERALDRVAARHESLRTTFTAELGVPFQTVHDALPRLHARVDLTALDLPRSHEEIEQRQAAELRTPFDLERGPPWRSTLLVLGAEEHVLLVTMSHLVSDAASIQRWLAELASAYASDGGDAPDLPSLPIQPVDLAVWRRRALALGHLDADRAYWRAILAGASPPAELPAEGRRGPGDVGGWTAAEVPALTALGLRTFAQARSTTPFAVLLATLATLLAELTGEPAVSIGVLSAGRDEPEAEPLIGLFLNAVPVRFTTAASFPETLARGHAALMGALAHSAVPFERIVADVGAPRQLRRNPLFDVVINHLPMASDVRLGEVQLEALDPPATIPSPFDLMWRVIERPSALVLRLEHHRGLFTRETAQRWLDRYLALLARVVREG